MHYQQTELRFNIKKELVLNPKIQRNFSKEINLYFLKQNSKKKLHQYRDSMLNDLIGKDESLKRNLTIYKPNVIKTLIRVINYPSLLLHFFLDFFGFYSLWFL